MKPGIIALALIALACAKPSPTPAPVVTASTITTTERTGPVATGTIMVRAMGTEDRFIPGMGAQALKDFVAEVKPDESGGECSLSRTRGNGALMVIAYYPTRSASNTQVVITFDSVGHVVHYTETRGVPHIKPGLRMEQADSARRAIEATMRSTSVSFDYPVDRAFAMNRGAGKPTVAITSTVREMENLENLQRPTARMERARKLCGV
jgi:hypothetical protein